MPLHINKTVYKVNDFLSWQRSGSLLLSPNFQRRPVWRLVAKSYLLDTVVRGLPIPIIFLRERTNVRTLEPEREVVDGQQRLRTLISFIEPAALKDYDQSKDEFVIRKTHNSDLAGKAFAQLDRETKAQILNYEFSVHVLPASTGDREVFKIFARLNSNGVKLTRQELRNASFFGPFKESMYELAYEQLSRWRNWKIFTESGIARMEEVELTSELALLMFIGIQGKSQPTLDKTYERFEEEFPSENEIARRFRLTMDKIEDLLGHQMQTLAFSRKTLFYILFAFIYDELYGLRPTAKFEVIEGPSATLKKVPPAKISQKVKDGVQRASDAIKNEQVSEELLKVLRGATGNLGTRQTQMRFLRDTCDVKKVK